jgi:hypothetical protein
MIVGGRRGGTSVQADIVAWGIGETGKGWGAVSAIASRRCGGAVLQQLVEALARSAMP